MSYNIHFEHSILKRFPFASICAVCFIKLGTYVLSLVNSILIGRDVKYFILVDHVRNDGFFYILLNVLPIYNGEKNNSQLIRKI